MAKVELIRKDGKPIGWTISGETPEEQNEVNTIRNLQFFGMDGTGIEYCGRTGTGHEYAGNLIWAQRQFADEAKQIVVKAQSINEAG